MKTLAFLFKAIPVILISVICLRCDILSEDKCDGTVAPEISIGIKATVHICGKQNLPMKNKRINVAFYKIPCGAEPKGKFKFEGVTDGDGDFYTPEVDYYLRNKEDKIDVEAVSPDIIVGGISPGNLEYVAVMYDDFRVGTIKNVNITLISNE